MEHRTDILLALQSVLTVLEREAFLSAFIDPNPDWRGAQIADILDAAMERDAYIHVTEPFHELYEREIEALQPQPAEYPLITAAAIVVHLVMHHEVPPSFLKIKNPLPWEPVLDLITRVRSAVKEGCTR